MTDPTTRTQQPGETEAAREHHTCPVWVGRLLASPLRRLVEDPREILGRYVSPGATVVDVGSAMGFYSLELARLVGPRGRVVSLDIQQEMLDGLVKRARRKGLDAVIEPRLCTQDGLGIGDLTGIAELVAAFNVVHETARPTRFLGECAAALRPGGRLLVVEPKGHVTDVGFADTVSIVRSTGLDPAPAPAVWRSRTALFVRP